MSSTFGQLVQIANQRQSWWAWAQMSTIYPTRYRHKDSLPGGKFFPLRPGKMRMYSTPTTDAIRNSSAMMEIMTGNYSSMQRPECRETKLQLAWKLAKPLSQKLHIDPALPTAYLRTHTRTKARRRSPSQPLKSNTETRYLELGTKVFSAEDKSHNSPQISTASPPIFAKK